MCNESYRSRAKTGIRCKQAAQSQLEVSPVEVFLHNDKVGSRFQVLSEPAALRVSFRGPEKKETNYLTIRFLYTERISLNR